MSVSAVYEANFIVRKSGTRENSCYIDYMGVYKVAELARITGISALGIKRKYAENGAVYDKSQEVYYFGSIESARKAISDMMKDIRQESKGRTVYLTEAEIEYIRKALISEGASSFSIKNKVKDSIFKKLNA